MFDPIAYINEPRWQTVSLGLDRTRELLAALGDPQDSLRFVHVAGTNGKGSTCALLASVLQQAGYRVGLFTSPALYRFEDRIRVNGLAITPERLLEVTLSVKEAAEAMSEHPTEFELLTAVAFEHFARERCDIVVAEVGLGGRLDSTNVIEAPEVAIITPISFDHRAMLGDTLARIASEKAGIIKSGTCVVSAPQEPVVSEVIEETAKAVRATVVAVDRARLTGTTTCFSYRDRDALVLGLSGTFQLVNAATALDALDVLKARGWNISERAIRQGLEQATWAGRFERVCSDPLIIFDGGHNIAGMEALIRALDTSYLEHHRIAVTGVLQDKDHRDMGLLLDAAMDEIVAVPVPNARALGAEAYAQELASSKRPSDRVESIAFEQDVEAGVRYALERYRIAKEQGLRPLIVVCGSLYLLGSVMEVLRQVGVAL